MAFGNFTKLVQTVINPEASFYFYELTSELGKAKSVG